jgi:hypothetical protein
MGTYEKLGLPLVGELKPLGLPLLEAMMRFGHQTVTFFAKWLQLS